MIGRLQTADIMAPNILRQYNGEKTKKCKCAAAPKQNINLTVHTETCIKLQDMSIVNILIVKIAPNVNLWSVVFFTNILPLAITISALNVTQVVHTQFILYDMLLIIILNMVALDISKALDKMNRVVWPCVVLVTKVIVSKPK